MGLSPWVLTFFPRAHRSVASPPAAGAGAGEPVAGPPPARCAPPLHASRGQMDAIASGGLKRKFEDADVGSPASNSDDEISNSDSADSCDSVNPSSSTGFIREWPGMGTGTGTVPGGAAVPRCWLSSPHAHPFPAGRWRASVPEPLFLPLLSQPLPKPLGV